MFSQHSSPSIQSLSSPTTLRCQQGVALLTVLLLVVSITVIAGSMLASQKVTTRKSSLLFDQDRLMQQLNSGQIMAVNMIRTDAKLNDFDSDEDIWAKKIPTYQTEDGYTIELTINDAAARFNLNNLYHHGTTDKHALSSFQRLLESLDIDPQLATVVLDWQDPDGKVHNDGGDEAIVYQAGDGSPVQVANQPFVSIEQLMDLPEVTAEIIATLRPYVTAVPYWLPINVNTANEQVLQSVLTIDIDSEEANATGGKPIDNSLNSGDALKKLMAKRKSQPIQSKEALKKLQLFADLNEPNDANQPATKVSAKKVDGKEAGDKTDKESKEAVAKKEKIKQRQQAIAQAEAMLDVQSRAFEVLIVARNSDKKPSGNNKSNHNNNIKSRYATLMIAKQIPVDNTESSSSPMSQFKNFATQSNEPIIESYAQRMWAYQPAFISLNN